MKLQIRQRNRPVTKRLREHIERRVGLALGSFGERVGRVIVRLSDGKDAAGERLCEIEATLRPRSVRAQDSHVDPIAAINHAAARVARSIARVLADEPDTR